MIYSYIYITFLLLVYIYIFSLLQQKKTRRILIFIKEKFFFPKKSKKKQKVISTLLSTLFLNNTKNQSIYQRISHQMISQLVTFKKKNGLLILLFTIFLFNSCNLDYHPYYQYFLNYNYKTTVNNSFNFRCFIKLISDRNTKANHRQFDQSHLKSYQF